MNIQQATRSATLNHYLGMRRQLWCKDKLVLKPTDTQNCTEMYREGKILSSRWNPNAEDLIANDWEACAINSEELDYFRKDKY